MLAALLLAAASHCADPGFCPTLKQFKTAVEAQDYKDEWEAAEALNADGDSDEYVILAARQKLLRITDYYCERPDREEPRSVTCKANFHHPRGIHYRMFILTRRDRTWQVEQQLGVLRKTASASPCADPGFCPTPDQLRRAALLDDDEEFGILIDDPSPVRRVTDLYCDAPGAEPRWITCKATFHYRTGASFQMINLSRGSENWKVDQRLEVFQKR